MLYLDAYEFVWGSDSKNFSEDIVRSYICKHGMIVKERSRRQLSRSNIAAIHKGGSANNTVLANRLFGRTVNAMYFQSKYLCILHVPMPMSIVIYKYKTNSY